MSCRHLLVRRLHILRIETREGRRLCICCESNVHFKMNWSIAIVLLFNISFFLQPVQASIDAACLHKKIQMYFFHGNGYYYYFIYDNAVPSKNHFIVKLKQSHKRVCYMNILTFLLFYHLIIDYGYPYPIEPNWPNLPNDLDCSLTYNNTVYFFKGDLLYV
jgi:hypothetical protein